jgi:hypothetical protein
MTKVSIIGTKQSTWKQSPEKTTFNGRLECYQQESPLIKVSKQVVTDPVITTVHNLNQKYLAVNTKKNEVTVVVVNYVNAPQKLFIERTTSKLRGVKADSFEVSSGF